jgi:hypothetical protein
MNTFEAIPTAFRTGDGTDTVPGCCLFERSIKGRTTSTWVFNDRSQLAFELPYSCSYSSKINLLWPSMLETLRDNFGLSRMESTEAHENIDGRGKTHTITPTLFTLACFTKMGELTAQLA